jgi:DNA-binding protein YbaB
LAVDFTKWEAELAGARVSGTGPDRLAQAVVDGTGRLVDLRLDPSLMRRPAGAVAKEVLGAVASAQGSAHAQRTNQADGLADLAQRMAADAETYRDQAGRQLEELDTLVSDLLRSRERAS